MARKRLAELRPVPEFPGMLRLARVDPPEILPDTPEFRAACEAYVKACHRENMGYAALFAYVVPDSTDAD